MWLFFMVVISNNTFRSVDHSLHNEVKMYLPFFVLTIIRQHSDSSNLLLCCCIQSYWYLMCLTWGKFYVFPSMGRNALHLSVKLWMMQFCTQTSVTIFFQLTGHASCLLVYLCLAYFFLYKHEQNFAICDPKRKEVLTITIYFLIFITL